MIFDFADLSRRDRHKLLISTIVPRPIAWISTLNEDGSVNVGPYSFFNIVCEQPPLVSVGVGSGERGEGDLKDTGQNIRRTGEFVVNLVGFEQAPKMVTTAVNFAPGVSEAHKARLDLAASMKITTPRLAESPVSLECRLHRTVDLAERQVLVLGEVVALHIGDDAVLDAGRCYIDTPKLDLIARMHGNGWYTRTTDWFQMPTPASEARTAVGSDDMATDGVLGS
jgi:flavin reductase (DIM6/NTAB) family NADH-FMN oxidoreductase RutF